MAFPIPELPAAEVVREDDSRFVVNVEGHGEVAVVVRKTHLPGRLISVEEPGLWTFGVSMAAELAVRELLVARRSQGD